MNILLSLTFLIVLSPSVFASTTIYEAPPREPLQEEKTIWREEEILDFITQTAGNNAGTVKKIVLCEAPWKLDDDGRYYDINDSQSRLKYNEGQIRRNPSWGKVGEREKSYGLGQIHTPAHTSITIEQASDPIFAINFIVKEVAKGNARIWTCSKA